MRSPPQTSKTSGVPRLQMQHFVQPWHGVMVRGMIMERMRNSRGRCPTMEGSQKRS